MLKPMRATDIAARLIEARPEWESAEEFTRRVHLPSKVSVDILNRRKDIGVGLLYQICKAFGYQIMIYNPNPPEGLRQCYVIGEKKSPIKPREKKGDVHYTRDAYNNQFFRATRKYKRKKGFVKLVKKGSEQCREAE